MRKEHLVEVDTEEAALPFWFPRAVLLHVEGFTRVALSVGPSGISCS